MLDHEGLEAVYVHRQLGLIASKAEILNALHCRENVVHDRLLSRTKDCPVVHADAPRCCRTHRQHSKTVPMKRTRRAPYMKPLTTQYSRPVP